MPTTLTYSPPLSQIPADPLRGNPCDSRDPRRCLQPLEGHQNPRTAPVSYWASSPYGERLPFEIEGGTSVSPAPTDHCSPITVPWIFTFSAKERDSETGLSYFGSRYYSSDLSIWLSVDPMAAKYASLSPYVYCANNPVRCVDPNGEEIGNYYDINGTYLGTDGKNDGEVYVVVTEEDKNMIKNNDNAGGTTQVSDVESAMRLPLPETRQEIYNQMTEGDKANGFAEHGGIYGVDMKKNKETARPAVEGPTCDPTANNTIAPIDYNTVDINWFNKTGTYHCHPSGEKNGSFFIQHPSEVDYNNAKERAVQHKMTGTNMVFGMRNNKVYLYNSKGYRATMSVEVFLNLR